MKQNIAILILLAIVVASFFIGKDYGAKGEIVKCQDQKLITNDVTKETIKKAIKRRRVNSTVPISDVWNKLFEKYCSDCSRAEHLPSSIPATATKGKGS